MNAVEHYLMNRTSDEPVCAYVYDLNGLRDHAEGLKSSLPSGCRFYYAVKANSDQPILEALEPIVDGFEVASAGEMDKVEAVSEKPMIFGGPSKKNVEIEAAIESGVEYLNVESFHELRRLNFIAEQKGTTVPILVRVNLSENVSNSHLRMSGVPTQFGVDERDIPPFLAEALEMSHVDIAGFHFHAMSNNLDAEAHVAFVRLCLEKSADWRERFGLDARVVDIGGGIGINYWNPDEPFDWDTLAEGLKELDSADVELIIEIGRYMTAACGSYVTEVVDVKRNHGKNFAVIRGGTHHLRLPAAWKMSHPFHVLPVEEWSYPFLRPTVARDEVTIAGELCTPNDVLVRGEYVDELRAGDVVVFEYAGAYAWTISHHEFLSHPKPEIVYIEK
ncbi:type III PLP-dependent enzyme [Halobacillus litoralis]|uniref:type III PLP-dependent enzyme n=1 Tax=Halobacillus litoralis TaxID=45668 RepID=UPI001CD61EC8|nr:type III PLP-dependent enzyme [Halobacillus litoralis]MCA0972120.1 type III PLP-dependent enzyme [Halobacillus litoralis]